MQLGQRIADICEAVHLAAQGVFQILAGEDMKLFQYPVHAAATDGVELVGRSSDGGEANFVESQVLLEMTEDFDDIRDTRGQRHARRNWARAVVLNQRPDSGLNNVIAAPPVREYAKLIVHFLWTVHTDGDANAVF